MKKMFISTAALGMAIALAIGAFLAVDYGIKTAVGPKLTARQEIHLSAWKAMGFGEHGRICRTSDSAYLVYNDVAGEESRLEKAKIASRRSSKEPWSFHRTLVEYLEIDTKKTFQDEPHMANSHAEAMKETFPLLEMCSEEEIRAHPKPTSTNLTAAG